MAVVDANALMSTIIALPWSDRAHELLAGQPQLLAPTLVEAELANALWKSATAGVISEADAASGISRALRRVVKVSDDDLVQRAFDLALRLKHPAYDCFYLALSLRSSMQLLTADRKLQSLAKQIGISAVSLN